MDILICSAPEIEPEAWLKTITELGISPEEVAVCRTREELTRAIRTREGAVRDDGLRFRFSTKEGVHMLALSRVRYFSGEEHRILAHLDDGTVLRSRTMRISTEDALRPLIVSGRFIRIARTCYVNLEHLTLITANQAHLKSGEILPISRGYSAKLRKEARLTGER